MPEEVTFTPGNHETAGTWTNDSVPNIDNRLADTDGDYIVDTSGDRILLGGGFEDGDDTISTTWQPGDSI